MAGAAGPASAFAGWPWVAARPAGRMRRDSGKPPATACRARAVSRTPAASAGSPGGRRAPRSEQVAETGDLIVDGVEPDLDALALHAREGVGAGTGDVHGRP